MGRILSSHPARVAVLLAVILTLVACGKTADRTPSTEPSIARFSARPLELGGGQWELSWDTVADEVTISGIDRSGPLASTGVVEVIVASGTPTEFRLTARIGGTSVSSEPITLAGLDTPATLLPAGPIDLTVGSSMELTASVTATGSEVDPSQTFVWSTVPPGDEEVLTVSVHGVVEALSLGTATVRATSAQWAGAYIETQITVHAAPPDGISEFALATGADWYAGSQVELTWKANAVEHLLLRTTDSSGDELSAVEIAPGTTSSEVALPVNVSQMNIELVWQLADGITRTTSLFSEPEPVPGWVCSDPDSQITFGDERVEAEVRKLPYISRAPGEPLRCSDVQPAVQPAPVLDADGMEQSNLIFLNRCYTPEDMRIRSTEGLQHLTQLARLELECNRISDIRFVASMTGLSEINFDNNHIADLSPLTGLTDLEVLGLYNNRVRNTAPLAGLENLRILYLSANHVRDVGPLADLQNLELLWLYLNCQTIHYNDNEEPDWGEDCLVDASPLGDLTSLESLVLLGNSIRNIDFLNPDMTELELVLLAGNLITDVSALGDLPGMTSVVLNDNPISDLSTLAANTDFPAGEPYGFTRGTVSMPSRDQGSVFGGHLILGFNCLSDPDGQLEAFAPSVEIVVIGDDHASLSANCDVGMRSLSTHDSERRIERLKALLPSRDVNSQ